MSKSYKILSPQDLQNVSNSETTFALDVLNGLSEHPKRLSSKYFYDDTGSVYFQKIMNLPEYYLTRCETEIIE
ncbi:MAG: L-histidine N(alpha)-methyltransferase, partial [Calditrichaeota bacterium]|nr:L-histidine N(alpha)-methyltransferase [Calditrichota bacterium]